MESVWDWREKQAVAKNLRRGNLRTVDGRWVGRSWGSGWVWVDLLIFQCFISRLKLSFAGGVVCWLAE